VHYAIRVVGEREAVPASGLAGQTLAVVDEESDITYFGVDRPAIDGATDYEPPADVRGVLLSDRVVVWDAPDGLYERGFYGQPLTGRAAAVEGVLQLSLLEAASLAADDRLGLDEVVETGDGAAESESDTTAAIVARGRAVEGDRFDRRLATYRDLRDRDAVPKTGFKFGADFRTYLDVETVESLPHSEHLVRVVEPGHAFAPRELSLDVRLAGGVRKQLLFALTDGTGPIEWLSVGRLTP
ncbi:tRNA-intron lyase, partial [Halorubrum tibetense]